MEREDGKKKEKKKKNGKEGAGVKNIQKRTGSYFVTNY